MKVDAEVRHAHRNFDRNPVGRGYTDCGIKLGLLRNLCSRDKFSTQTTVADFFSTIKCQCSMQNNLPIVLNDNVSFLLRWSQREIFKHPLYSPDINPKDFDLFSKLEELF
ncbi:hypothetical protein TNCV_2118191 [Trichonephila clavipes]|nr:hypothetical protein TNCV_2118191 [Trichonephila clavipes]